MSQEYSNNKSFYIVFALSIALVLMAGALYTGSHASMQPGSENTIQMSGNAEQKVIPDTVSISIGVVTESATSKEASDENAALMTAVLKELKDLGLQDKDIRTSYVSVYPVYNYDGVRTIEGYSASNSVEVTTTDLALLSDIVDRSTAAGANQIGSVSFSVSDEMQKELREELIDEAVEDSSSKAEILAKSLGVKIIGVQTSSISDSMGSRMYYGAAEMVMDEEESSTPIMPGESTVSMSVQVTYLIK
ncbi:SIMPL domain-containing protein [Methanococcoides methylutens]|uniref:SIMPL domain-containing protein n=1 Tax=Methanococcoides methylutens TaxID=2226 RepID=UPI0040439B5B